MGRKLAQNHSKSESEIAQYHPGSNVQRPSNGEPNLFTSYRYLKLHTKTLQIG